MCIAGGKGAYGAIDAIGGATSPKIVASLRKSGKYILYGALDTSPVSASNTDLLSLTKVISILQQYGLCASKAHQCLIHVVQCSDQLCSFACITPLSCNAWPVVGHVLDWLMCVVVFVILIGAMQVSLQLGT